MEIEDKLNKLSFQLGFHDYSTSVHDNYESYNEKEKILVIAKVLLSIINEDNFAHYIMKNEEALNQYFLGYIQILDYEEDIPQNINKGFVCSIELSLTKEQQNKLKNMALEKIKNN